MFDPQPLYSLPVSAWIWICWGRLEQQTGPAIDQGTIHHITVTCDPADVSHATKQFSLLVVKCMFVSHCSVEKISCRTVTQTLTIIIINIIINIIIIIIIINIITNITSSRSDYLGFARAATSVE